MKMVTRLGLAMMLVPMAIHFGFARESHIVEFVVFLAGMVLFVSYEGD